MGNVSKAASNAFCERPVCNYYVILHSHWPERAANCDFNWLAQSVRHLNARMLEYANVDIMHIIMSNIYENGNACSYFIFVTAPGPMMNCIFWTSTAHNKCLNNRVYPSGPLELTSTLHGRTTRTTHKTQCNFVHLFICAVIVVLDTIVLFFFVCACGANCAQVLHNNHQSARLVRIGERDSTRHKRQKFVSWPQSCVARRCRWTCDKLKVLLVETISARVTRFVLHPSPPEPVQPGRVGTVTTTV